MDYKNIMTILKNRGYKNTPQREAIIRVLSSNHNNILTAEEILALAKRYNDSTNLTTVYRNLELLEKEALLYKVIHPEGYMAFKLSCKHEHHHHLICTQCGAIEVLDYCPLSAIKDIAQAKSFEVTGHIVEIYGICKNCQVIAVKKS